MATIEHCLFCFETLAAHLEKRPAMTLAQVQQSYAAYIGAMATEAARIEPPSVAAPPSPLFVTWNTSDGADEDEDTEEDEHGHRFILRGCIGTFERQDPLEDGLAMYALTAALNDSRFRPIARRELPQLQVGVTLLTDFEPATGGPLDWELGKHGLRLSFSGGSSTGRRYSATYLPDVAPEQGWTKEQTIVNLMRKAGWSGRAERWRQVEDLRVVRYQGKKHTLEYADFARWREWEEQRAKGGLRAQEC